MDWRLSWLFNRSNTLDVPLKDLAEAVKPFIYEKGDDNFSNNADLFANKENPELDVMKPFNWETDLTPAYVAEGWREAAQWLQVAFCDENPKGNLYFALHHSLSGIGRSLSKADPAARMITLDKKQLSLLKGASLQFSHAADSFNKTAAIQKGGEKLTVRFKTGQLASISPLPFSKMPGADHDLVAKQMKMTQRRMDALTKSLGLRTPKEHEYEGYKPHHLRHEL